MLAVTGVAPTLAEAVARAYAAVEQISFEGGGGAGSVFSFCNCWKRKRLLLFRFRDALQFFNHIGRDTFPPALFPKRFQIATPSSAATADSRTGLPSGCPRTLQDGVTASRRKAALGTYQYQRLAAECKRAVKPMRYTFCHLAASRPNFWVRFSTLRSCFIMEK